jgi:uncharacterized protein (DUF2132 family)
MGAKDPLHGKTLEMILTELVEHFGWEDLGSVIDIGVLSLIPASSQVSRSFGGLPGREKKSRSFISAYNEIK